MTTYSGEFEEHIRDLLSNLYDYLKLNSNPAAQQLAANLTGNEKMHAIRQTILRAIEELRREDRQNPTARGNRLYNILLLRYVEEQSTTEVLNQLALSERQYYREHQRAIQTISQIIWDEHFSGAAADAGEANLSLVEELNYLNIDNGHKVFYLKEEILTAVKATAVIAAQRGIEIRLSESQEPITLNVSQPVFRQFIIYLLNALIGATGPNGRIEIGLRMHAGSPVVLIRDEALLEDGRGFCARLQADGTARALMKNLNVELRWTEELPQISLGFKMAIHNILIVDDNPDTINLFKRYLANLPYRLLSARGESEALSIAQRTNLLCIILDIMLPGKDGWQILQSYKSHPATEDIPVLICSVLEMEELALSLGADGYLKKPPARDEFLSTLSQWVE